MVFLGVLEEHSRIPRLFFLNLHAEDLRPFSQSADEKVGETLNRASKLFQVVSRRDFGHNLLQYLITLPNKITSLKITTLKLQQACFLSENSLQ